MCGITGFIDTSIPSRSDLLTTVHRMTATLAHRGPDSHGVWTDDDAGVALGHRRLSIIDLSEGGQQPMLSSNGRYVITYNGEIYNYLELRRQLENKGRGFRS